MSLLTQQDVRHAFGYGTEARIDGVDRAGLLGTALRGMAEELAATRRELAALKREHDALKRSLRAEAA